MSQTRLLMPAVAVLALALSACGNSTTSANTDAAAEADRAAAPASGQASAPAAEAAAASASVELAPTQGHETAGTLRFATVDGRIQVTGTVTGLPPGGTHGFHVHEKGDCSAPDGTSAGGHFNPASSDHGRVGHGAHHVGDSDNIVAGTDGTASVDTWLEGATLGDGAPTDIVGKAVIVHANADDYVTQPTGNAGDRLACGVIRS
ncbi:superoxide dismutase family protein [Luteimonas sp. S4-F44]|uniref:superoxide dismutase family protein n=1 Tax=Luteimonas sp. S4-F44 TaxID=2925842 RepID=UPI001F52D42E|nr:superoxide dismutase family protein [Luteimonas sp. S4-F44]UNK42565.1 superoxide dismutase family protein [Luteimonas sp. S4-F44]